MMIWKKLLVVLLMIKKRNGRNMDKNTGKRARRELHISRCMAPDIGVKMMKSKVKSKMRCGEIKDQIHYTTHIN